MHPSLSNSDQLGRRPDFITTTTGYFRWTTSIWPLPLPRLRRGAILALGFAGVVLASIPGLQAAPAVGVPITWGRTLDGQLGNGTGGTDINATQNVAGLVDTTGVLAGKSITAVSMGTQYCLALDSNGKIYSWGTNGDYDLGTTSVTVGSGYTTTPVAVDMTGVLSGKTVTAISAGITESMALTSDGKVYTWGNRTTLGDGTSNASAVPVAVDMTGALSGKTVTAIATGGDFCMVLTSEGKVYTWGANTNGQLGNNTNGLYDQYSFIPVPVDTSGVLAGKTVTAIAAGEGHALVLTSDNKLFSWGGVAHALGAGSSVALAANGGSNGPVAVDMSGVLNGRTVVQIAAGQNFSVALTSDGKVFTWGDEGNGNLGNGTRGYDSSQYVPVAVDMTGVLAGLSVTHISCGYQSVVVQASDGKLYAWGDNTYGQLGYTGVSEADTPLAVDTSGVLSNYTVTALGTGGGGNDRSVVVIGVANTVVAPAISTQPVSQTVTAGSSVTFSVAATGTPLSYQWQKGGVAIAGATSSSFIIASTSAGDAGSYTVVVSNSAGNVTSIAATLTVNPLIVAPTIITQPTSQTVTTGNSVTFSVTATGTSPTYQWQKGGVAISGATSSSFTIASTSSGDAGTYTVVVSNTAGNVTSNGATLTLTASVVAPSITAQPSSQTVTAGNTVTFNVTANGTSLSYQWQKGGVAIAGATGSSLNFTAGTSDAGIYTVVVSNSAGSVTSSAATLTVNTSIAAPTITTQPASTTVNANTNVVLSVAATGTGLSYQWYEGSLPIADATSSSLSFNANTGNMGNYSVVISNAGGSVTSNFATVNVLAGSRIVNVSVRGQAGSGADSLIVGFIISGPSTKSYLIRGVGPALTGFGVSNAVPHPKLTVWDSSGNMLGTNSQWGGGAALTNAFATTGAFPLPASSDDDAILQTLAAGAYTGLVAGPSPTGDVALAEIYDVDTADQTTQLINGSGRGHVGSGTKVLIAGFIVSGSTPSHLLVRGVGPGLVPLGVSGTLADPVLTVYDASGHVVAANDNWGGTSTLLSTFAQSGAFPLDAASKDAALELTVQPGAYTAVISSADATSGIALVEVYSLP